MAEHGEHDDPWYIELAESVPIWVYVILVSGAMATVEPGRTLTSCGRGAVSAANHRVLRPDLPRGGGEKRAQAPLSGLDALEVWLLRPVYCNHSADTSSGASLSGVRRCIAPLRCSLITAIAAAPGFFFFLRFRGAIRALAA